LATYFLLLLPKGGYTFWPKILPLVCKIEILKLLRIYVLGSSTGCPIKHGIHCMCIQNRKVQNSLRSKKTVFFSSTFLFAEILLAVYSSMMSATVKVTNIFPNG
jgi:hypothetical protein